MPVFNGEKYLSSSVESVLGQTYVNIELLLIDDGSTDSTYKIGESFAQRDKRIRFFSIENRGRAGARNFAIDAAEGSYIAFLDADDFWFEDKLEKQMAIFSENSEIKLVYSQREWVDSDGNAISGYESHNLPSGKIFEQLIEGNYLCTSTVCVDIDVVRSVGGFDQSKKFTNCQDYDLWLRASLLGEFFGIDDKLTYYRIHDSNAHSNVKSRYIGLCSCVGTMRRLAGDEGLDDDIYKLIDIRELELAAEFAAPLFSAGCYGMSLEAYSLASDLVTFRFKDKIKILISRILSRFSDD